LLTSLNESSVNQQLTSMAIYIPVRSMPVRTLHQFFKKYRNHKNLLLLTRRVLCNQ